MRTKRCSAAKAGCFSVQEWFAFGLISAFLSYVVFGAIAILTRAFGPLGSALWGIGAVLLCPGLIVATCRLIPAGGTPDPVLVQSENDSISFLTFDEHSDEAITGTNTATAIAEAIERIVQKAGAVRNGGNATEPAQLFGEAPPQ